jgi:hypothetical protein
VEGLGRKLAALCVCVAALALPGAAEAPITRFEEPSFRLALPGEWRALHSSDTGFWPYRRADDRAQVSVAIAFARTPVPREELAGVFAQFNESRREAVTATASDCSLGETRTQEHLEAVAGSYVAECGSEGRRMGDFLVARRDLIASFLLDARDMSEEEFRILFTAVASGASLAQPGAQEEAP